YIRRNIPCEPCSMHSRKPTRLRKAREESKERPASESDTSINPSSTWHSPLSASHRVQQATPQRNAVLKTNSSTLVRDLNPPRAHQKNRSIQSISSTAYCSDKI